MVEEVSYAPENSKEDKLSIVYVGDGTIEEECIAFQAEEGSNLSGSGIVDTGCTKFMLGEETLNAWGQDLLKRHTS